MTAIAPAATTTWAIDASHSLAEFSVKHMMISTAKGSFTDIVGQITLDEERFANSAIQVEIRTESITTRDEKRDAHLRSADFFDTETFPLMTFASTSVIPGKGDDFTLIGDLTIHGTTRQVEIKSAKTGSGVTPWGQSVIGFEGDTKINRKDFGLAWNVALETGGILLGEEVKIHLQVEATAQ